MIGVRLSDKEQAVLLALIECADGNEAMAEWLNMTRGGVGRHLTNFYRKTGTTNKIALLRWTLREASRALRIAGRTRGEAGEGMKLFQAQVYLPESDEHVHVAEALMVIASPIVNDPEQQPAAKAFILSVTGEAVRAEAISDDGEVVFATLRFDGQRFILVAAGLV